MKAIHLETQGEFQILEIRNNKVSLKSFATGSEKKVDYIIFKSDYEMLDDVEEVSKFIPDVETESKEAHERATEISKEIEGELRRSETIIRVDFSEKADRPIRKEKVAKIKVDNSNLILLKDICIEIGLDPTKARRILRKKGISKPGPEWAWDNPHSVLEIKALLK